MTLDRWLAKHPYLEPIARLDAEVEREIDGIPLGTAGIPNWDRYFADYVAGVPLLESQVGRDRPRAGGESARPGGREAGIKISA